MQINLSVGEIKRIIKTDCGLDDSFLINKIASLENANQSDIAIILDRGENSVFNQISVEKIKNSKASVILTKDCVVEDKNYLLVEDPLDAFCKIVDFVKNKDFIEKAYVDQTAIIGLNTFIENGSSIGAKSFIGANSYIGKNVKIGSNVKIYPGVNILDDSIVGDNCIIHSGAVIGSDGFGYSVTKSGLRKIPQIGIVKIGCNVEIGANCSIDRASFEQTIIGNGVKLDNQVHIAHNVIIGDHTVVLAQTGIAGGAIVGSGCQIGGQVAIRDHIKIGNSVKIVSKSAVLKNVEDEEVIAGIPSMPFLQWKRMAVAITKLPEVLKDFKKLQMLAENIKNKKGFFKRFWG